MQLAINAALWITSLVMSFFAATNDVAWYLQAETSRPLMACANCSVPTLGCIRQAKAAGVALAQAHDEHYWCSMREEAAKAEKARADQEAYDVSVADAFTKAEKYDMLIQNLPQPIININNSIINNYNTFNMAPPSKCTLPPAAHDIPLHRLTIGEEVSSSTPMSSLPPSRKSSTQSSSSSSPSPYSFWGIFFIAAAAPPSASKTMRLSKNLTNTTQSRKSLA
jgi:hypothetical protein